MGKKTVQTIYKNYQTGFKNNNNKTKQDYLYAVYKRHTLNIRP